jgi:hypothetical protein
MPSGETLRFTLVCKLPLLHFSRSRVAVVQRFGSASFNAHLFAVASPRLPFGHAPSEEVAQSLSSWPFSRFPSSSAPAFRPLTHSRKCLAWSELPLQAHNSCSSLADSVSAHPFWLPVGTGPSWSDGNPFSLFRQLSLFARLT